MSEVNQRGNNVKTNNRTGDEERILEGIAASPGIAIGTAFLLGGDVVRIRERTISPEEVAGEIEMFHEAVRATMEELKRIRREVAKDLGDESAKVFDAHQLMLEDELVIDETVRRIQEERKNADFIFFKVMRRIQESLNALDDDYLSARVSDLRDVKRRVIRHIQGDRRDHLAQLSVPAIIVANDLTPSDTVLLDRQKVLGFATDLGGRTSHAAIMARSLEMPSVVGLKYLSSIIQAGDLLILDGLRGKVIVNPDESTLEHYRQRQREFTELAEKLSVIRDLPARTLDGKDIELAANLEFPNELESVVAHGAKGVGLYRTEYLYMAKQELPDEDEQYEEYKTVVESLAPNPVIIRTIDIGGDKLSHSVAVHPEENPFLGMRAIRICLENHVLFKVQLRAILRASAHGEVKILLPMISSIDEIRASKELLEVTKKELRAEDVPFEEALEIGAMIEVPSAALIADLIARETDFLSIGTNDLIQYTLAVDRGNERVAHLYQAFNPAVIRLIKMITEAGHRQGVWVGMCGEMAGDPLATMMLVGLDLDELSVSPLVLPEIKEIIRSITYDDAKQIARHALKQQTASQVMEYLREKMHTHVPNLMSA